MELKISPDVLMFEIFKLRLEYINNFIIYSKLFLEDVLILSKSRINIPTNSIFYIFLINLEKNLQLIHGINVKLTCNYKEEFNIFKVIHIIIESGCDGVDKNVFLNCTLLTLLQSVDFLCLYIRLKIANEFLCDLRLVQYKDNSIICWSKSSTGGTIGFGEVELKYEHYDNKECLEKMYKKNACTINVFKKTPIYKGPETYIDPPFIEYNKLVTLFYNKK